MLNLLRYSTYNRICDRRDKRKKKKNVCIINTIYDVPIL